MTNPRALNLSDDFSSQIPQIQQMVQDNKILTGELIRPPQQITAFRIGGANGGGDTSSEANPLASTQAVAYQNNGVVATDPFTTVSGSGPGNMAASARTIPLRQRHWQAMVTGTLVLNYRDAMVGGFKLPGYAAADGETNGQQEQNSLLAQALFLDYGADTAANARQIMNCIWGLPMGSKGGLNADPDGSGDANPQVGTSAVLRILCDPGSTQNGPVATTIAVAAAGGGVGDRVLCGNSSRMTIDIAANATVGADPVPTPVFQALASPAKLVSSCMNYADDGAAGLVNTQQFPAVSFSCRVIFGNVDHFNSNLYPRNAAQPTTQGTNIIWDCGNVHSTGSRNIISVGGEQAADANAVLAANLANRSRLGFPMGLHDISSALAIYGTNSVNPWTDGTNVLAATNQAHPLVGGEVVIVATCINNTPGSEVLQFSLVNAIECAGTEGPILNYAYA
jgi:hypothetical protein